MEIAIHKEIIEVFNDPVYCENKHDIANKKKGWINSRPNQISTRSFTYDKLVVCVFLRKETNHCGLFNKALNQDTTQSPAKKCDGCLDARNHFNNF